MSPLPRTWSHSCWLLHQRLLDSAAQKKRVAATQKSAKEMEHRRMAALLPCHSLANSTISVPFKDFFGNPIIPATISGGVVIPSSSSRPLTRSMARSLTGLLVAANATELRRRKIQFTRDKRRRNKSSANIPDNPWPHFHSRRCVGISKLCELIMVSKVQFSTTFGWTVN